MIRTYHGTTSPLATNFTRRKLSRYGFPCLFSTDSITLAYEYAKHEHKTTNQEKKIYQVHLNSDHIKSVDFGCRNSYQADFKKLIIDNYRSGTKILRITNVYDYPDHGHGTGEFHTIYAIYDLLQVKEIREIDLTG